MSQNFYITTTLPYVNADPHIGFGLEIVAADVIARYQTSLGNNVFFNTGTDEHGQKIYEKALENNQSPQQYVDFYAEKFRELKTLFNLYADIRFIRTTDEHHVKAAQEFWKRCDTNGYIYKKIYKVKYCVGCELEKQDSELVEGKCPLHPTKALESREEENYFFKFSAFEEQLVSLYQTKVGFVQPPTKLHEIQSFVTLGLQDFSISRLKEKMPWGVPVPGDDEHVMYVWFDALVNYISTLGWPKDTEKFEKFWGTKDQPNAVQIAGKDNLRQQSAMWQAMLMAAGLPASRQILINGFISIDGQKMSKSLGNVISPKEMVDRYGIDATRFLLMYLGPIGNDMDTSWEKLDTIYTAHLVNGLGNLCSRVAKMCERSELTGIKLKKSELNLDAHTPAMNLFNLKNAIDSIVDQISITDKFLSEKQPWKKEGDEQRKILQNSVVEILQIAQFLKPFMPQTSQIIFSLFSADKIVAMSPLFPRLKT